MAVNVRAPLLLVRAALPLLAPDARIITVSAALTRRANPDVLMQSAAKAALQDASRNLAAELGPRGIGVVDVAPGVVRTDLSAPYLRPPATQKTPPPRRRCAASASPKTSPTRSSPCSHRKRAGSPAK